MAGVFFDQASKAYDGVEALRNLTLRIEDGELLVILGPSGCGKTTSLRLAAGLEVLTGGHIQIGDRTVDRLPPKDRDIGMVFQDYALYPQMNVFSNMAFGLRMKRYRKSAISDRVREVAETLGIGQLLERYPRELSGGQRQRVALGRALVREPAVFLMDEPLSNLDASLRVQMRGEIRRLQQRLSITTLFVTHDQIEAMTMGDRIAVLKDGLLQQVATPTEMYARPANVFVGGFLGSPGMAFNRFAVERDGTRISLVRGEIKLKIDAAIPGDSVIVGARPENIVMWRPDSGLLGPLEGYAEFIEVLGRETLVGARVSGETQLVARMDGKSKIDVGDRVSVGIDRGGLHFFDPTTEAALEKPGSQD